MVNVKILERPKGFNDWNNATQYCAYFLSSSYSEYRILLNDVEVCRVEGWCTENSILDFLRSHPTAGPILACIENE